MKHWGRIILLIVILFLLFGYLQFGREIEIKNTRILSFKNGYTEHINLVANKLYIMDKNKFAQEIINTFLDNSFNEVKFSFDLGFPSNLSLSVYMNEWDKFKTFEIYCVFDMSNDKKKPDCFEFEILESN